MKNLKKLRLERGLSQQKLADILHITQQSIYKYENGLAEPNIELLKNIADYFGTSVDYLVEHSVLSRPADQNLSSPISPSEAQHLYLYRQLTPEMKKAIDTIISEAVKHQ